MRNGWTWGAALAALLWMAPAALANGPPLEPARNQACAKKRTDACGCHHYYGLRHCHPKLKTDRCERPVSHTRVRRGAGPRHEGSPATWVEKREGTRATEAKQEDRHATHEAL